MIRRTCLNCNRTYFTYPSIRKKYCSMKCFGKHKKKLGTFKGENNPNYKGKLKEIACIYCDKPLKQKTIEQKYCSHVCSDKDTVAKGKLKGTKNPRYGHRWSAEWKKRQSQRQKEWLKKYGVPFKGKRHTEETKALLSMKQAGRIGKRGKQSHFWRGGIKKNRMGYTFIKYRGHPRAEKSGYILRSHLIVEKYLGRYLNQGEVVHHINGKVDDDRLKNLKLFGNSGSHTKFHAEQRRKLKWKKKQN